MRKLFLVFLFLPAFIHHAASQKIKRWNGRGKEITDQKLPLRTGNNIFNDYGWSGPDIGSRQLFPENDSCRFTWKGEIFTIVFQTAGVHLNFGQDRITYAERRLSDADIYYSKDAIPMYEVKKVRTEARLETVKTIEAVYKTRMVAGSHTDPETKKTVHTYTMEQYVEYEQGTRTYTTYHRVTYSGLEGKIPPYHYFTFELPDHSKLILYEIDAGIYRKYFLQNISYLQAEDPDHLKYVMIDANADGNYTGETDYLMLDMRWAPGKYNLYGGSWLKAGILETEYGISLIPEGDILSVRSMNQEFAGLKQKGKIRFETFPAGTRVYINGKHFRPKSGKSYSCQYGNYHVKFRMPDGRDFSRRFVVNGENPLQTLAYYQIPDYAYVQINNFGYDIYTVEVENTELDYTQSFFCRRNIKIPAGQVKLYLRSKGYAITRYYSLEKGQILSIDFDEECRKEDEK